MPRLTVLAMPLAVPAGFFTFLATPSQSQNAQFILMALFLAFVVGVCAFKSSDIRHPGNMWIAPIAALAASLVLSCVLSSEPLHAVETAGPLLGGLLFLAAGLLYPGFSQWAHKLYYINTWAAIALALLALAQTQGIGVRPELGVGKMAVVALFGHPNHSASYFLGAFFMACPLMADRHRPIRLTGVLGASLCLSALIACGGRGAWLGWLAGSALLAGCGLLARRPQTTFFKPALPVALVLVVSLGLLALPNPLLPPRFHLLERLPEQTQIRSRLYAWLVAADLFRDRPILGHGAGAYAIRFWDQAAARQTTSEGEWFEALLIEASGVSPVYAHNEWFHLAAEQGLFGLFAFFLLLSAVYLTFVNHFRHARRTRRRRRTHPNARSWPLVLSAFAGVVALLVDSLFHFPLRLAPSLFLFWALVLTVAVSEQDSEAAHPPIP